MHERYPVLNAWLERVLTKAAHGFPIVCALGWSLAATGRPGEERTFLNFPMQGNASELLRLIIVRASGLPLIGCAHDSFLIEAPIAEIEQLVARMQEIIREASRDLFGDELRAECDPDKDIVRYPDRFVDEREREEGIRNWNWLMALIEETKNDHAQDGQAVVTGRHGPSDDSGGNGADAGAATRHEKEAHTQETDKADEVSGQVGAHPGGMA